MHQAVILILTALTLCACATPEQPPFVPTAPKARAMAVHSVPTGMMVNVDNEWVGITPCVIMLPDDGNGG